MKKTMILIFSALFLIVASTASWAGDRDRHDRHDKKKRDHVVYQQEKPGKHDNWRKHDRDRHNRKAWKKEYRQKQQKKYAKKAARQIRKAKRWARRHHEPRHVVYQPVVKKIIYRERPRVIVRERAVLYPFSSFSLRSPDVSFHVSW